ncbi:MAG: protein kinase domain-containing protein, partial [Gemmatimonadales bacterium]
MNPDVKEIADRLQAALGSHYRIERELGRGGMGLVFLATDTTLDRPVAVKVIHPDLATRETVAQRFLAEARMIARLRHPNIVSVYSAGEATGIFYYVMDYVPGETLRDRLIREGRLSIEDAVRITAELAGALDAAAEAGLVHRDVKPENVLLDRRDGRALLVDFGVARVLVTDASAFVTGQGVAVGTPTYMSPEQASGDEVDRRSDLYALGVVAYEMLAGHPPFRGSSSAAVISMQLSEKPSPITRERPETPAPVGAAVMRSLEKPPDERWQTGREMRQALLGETAVRGRPGRKRPLGWVAAAAVMVLVTVGALLGLRPDRGPPEGVDPRHSLLILPFENQRKDPDVAWLREGSVNMLALTLSQWNDLTVVDQERLHDLLVKEDLHPDDPIGLETARQLARDAGVWTVVQGEYDAVGDSLFVSARVYDVATGARVNIATSKGATGADVRTL